MPYLGMTYMENVSAICKTLSIGVHASSSYMSSHYFRESRARTHLTAKIAQPARQSSATRHSFLANQFRIRVHCAPWPQLLQHVGCRRVLRPSSFGAMAPAEVGTHGSGSYRYADNGSSFLHRTGLARCAELQHACALSDYDRRQHWKVEAQGRYGRRPTRTYARTWIGRD